jgi:hypothetical protein
MPVRRPLTVEQILAWVELHFRRTGRRRGLPLREEAEVSNPTRLLKRWHRQLGNLADAAEAIAVCVRTPGRLDADGQADGAAYMLACGARKLEGLEAQFAAAGHDLVQTAARLDPRLNRLRLAARALAGPEHRAPGALRVADIRPFVRAAMEFTGVRPADN